MNDWDKILKDFAYKCGDGGPNMTNPNHLALLRESLLKFGWNENAMNEFLGNLREGKKKEKSNKVKKWNIKAKRWVHIDINGKTFKENPDNYSDSEEADMDPEGKTYNALDANIQAVKHIEDVIASAESQGKDVTKAKEQLEKVKAKVEKLQRQQNSADHVSTEMDGMTEERDKIFTGETTPPGNGGSAVMETLGGLYSEELARGEHQDETEDKFLDRMLQDYGDKPPLLGMSLKQQELWLKVAYRKGRNDLHGLKKGPHDFNPDQPKGYPKACSGDAETAAPVLGALEKQLANCKNDIDPPKCRKHYKHQIKVFKKRVRLKGEAVSGQKDSDSLLIYYDNQGRMRVHHISDKQTLADTFMNMTLTTKGESHARAMERTSARMGLTTDQSKDLQGKR